MLKSKTSIPPKSINLEEDLIIKGNRDIIYHYIRLHPGTHLRKISKDLALGMGDVQHHLTTLEKTGFVKARRISVYKVYYPVSILKERHESILAVLQQETPRTLLLYLIENPGASQGELATLLECSAPTVNWHMSKLRQFGLVNYYKDGKFVKYIIEGDPKDITNLLKSYYPTVWNRLSSRLADLFLDISPRTSLQEGKGND